MPAENSQSLETRVAIVEKEVGSIYNVFDRFEKALEKLTEVSSSLKEMIAVHEQRLQEREKIDPMIFDLIERRKTEHTQLVDRLSAKTEDMAVDLRRTIRAEVNEYGDELKHAILELKTAQREFVDTVDRKIEKVVTEQNTALEDLEERLQKLERWRWMLLGAGMVVGFVGSKWDLVAKLFGG